MAEFSSSPVGGGWVHDVSFSASGEQLAYVAHDACVYVAYGSAETDVVRFKTVRLPFTAVQWITPTAFIAAGHNYVPIVYEFKDNTIKELGMATGGRGGHVAGWKKKKRDAAQLGPIVISSLARR